MSEIALILGVVGLVFGCASIGRAIYYLHKEHKHHMAQIEELFKVVRAGEINANIICGLCSYMYPFPGDCPNCQGAE